MLSVKHQVSFSQRFTFLILVETAKCNFGKHTISSFNIELLSAEIEGKVAGEREPKNWELFESQT